MAKIKLSQERSEEFSLSNVVYATVMARQLRETERRKERKADDGFHLSTDIGMAIDDENYCRRKQTILKRFSDVLKPWMASKELAVTFEIGHEYHRWLQSVLRDAGEFSNRTMGLYGRWTCRKCEKVWYAFAPVGCPFCRARLHTLKYLEYPLHNKKWNIKTTSDGLLWVFRKGKWYEYLIEAKSIVEAAAYYGGTGFNNLVEPQGKHMMQAQGYLNLRYEELIAKRMTKKLPRGFTEWPEPAGLIVFYMNKNRPVFKEYQVKRKSKYWKAIKQRITDINNDIKKKKYAPRIEPCSTLKAAKKFKCDVAELCFDLRRLKERA